MGLQGPGGAEAEATEDVSPLLHVVNDDNGGDSAGGRSGLPSWASTVSVPAAPRRAYAQLQESVLSLLGMDVGAAELDTATAAAEGAEQLEAGATLRQPLLRAESCAAVMEATGKIKSRKMSSARWSVSHPVHEEPRPAAFSRARLFRKFLPGRKRSTEEAESHVVFVNDAAANAHHPKNVFTTSKYTPATFLVKNLAEQMRRIANIYFVLITLIQFVPGVSPFPVYITVAPLVFILGVTAVKEGYEDYWRHVADSEVNNVLVKAVDPATSKVHLRKSMDLAVGDIICVERDESSAADIVVLCAESASKNTENVASDAVCWVDTADLDGETRIKVRRAVPLGAFLDVETGAPVGPAELAKLRTVVTSDPPNPYIEVFSGRMDAADPNDHAVEQLSRENLILRGAVLRNTRRVWGVIVGAGPATKLRLNQQLPAYKFSRLERSLNVCLGVVFVGQTLMCVGLAAAQVSRGDVMSVLRINPDRLSWTDFNWRAPHPADPFMGRAFFAFLSFFILTSFFVPLSLFVILEFGKMAGGLYIQWDTTLWSRDGLNRPAKPNTTSLVEELGEVQFVLSDKTGTLTDNEMRLTHFASATGQLYTVDARESEQTVLRRDRTDSGDATIVLPLEEAESGEPDDPLLQLLFHMAACNALEVEEDETEEGECDLFYSGESPDEVALAEMAKELGCVLVERTPARLAVDLRHAGGKRRVLEILAVLPFSSSRKRMGVVLRERCSSQVHVLFKGADNVMLDLFDDKHDTAELRDRIDHMSNLGLRTLVLGATTLSEDSPVVEALMSAYEEAHVAMEDRDSQIAAAFAEVERELAPIGCTGVEDKLSSGVEEALQSLVRASVQVAVLTGDKTETAMSICRSCGLFKPESKFHRLTTPDAAALTAYLSAELEGDPGVGADEALVVSGDCLRLCLAEPKLRSKLASLMKRCYTTVCTRVTPKQKAQMTRLVRDEFGVVCLAIGDGANDVSMIREADVGVGIFGKEGAQAAGSADFAIHQFADLQTLLFVHGSLCRLRIVSAARASLFSNIAFALPQVMYAFQSAFSGVSIEVTNVLTFYNVAMTSPMLLAMACVGRDLLPSELMEEPALYDPHSATFSLSAFFEEIAYALWHAGVAFALSLAMGPVWVPDGVVAGMWAEGTLLSAIVVNAILVSLALRFHSLTKLHAVHTASGMLSFWLAAVALSEVWAPRETDNGFVLSYIGKGWLFWLATLAGVAASLLPWWALRVFRAQWRPSLRQIFREAKRLRRPGWSL